MKKGSIISLVFSCILFVFGAALVIASFRQAMAPVSIQHYAEGFSMRLSINNLSLAISSISLMFLILGCTLIISSLMLLILTFILHFSTKDEVVALKPEKETITEKSSETKAQKSKVQPHKPQKESVKAVDKPLEAKKEDVSTE